MKRNFFLLILSAYFSFCFFALFPRVVYSAQDMVVFEDSFENGFEHWDIVSGEWGIKEVNDNKMFGATVSGYDKVIEALAKESWFDDYVFELDMLGVRGADKNLIFRIKDSDNRYGIHINSDKNLVCIERWINGQGWDKCEKKIFSNDVYYRLKVVAIKNRILFYANEQLVFDFVDTEFPIYSGSVGLKVSTGASSPSEVYFDNIRVTKINTPVILIPGHGASFNFKEMFLGQSDPDGWQMTPGVNIYKNIVASLEANGYEEGKDLFVFNYNWLNSISDSADKLYTFVENLVNSSYFSSVKVIGHSMGGLVAKTCSWEKEDNCFIDQLITVGSPHQGVLESYAAWEGGEIWRDGLTKLAFELFLNTQKGRLETNKEAIRRLSPSLEEMLPTFAYLKSVQGEEIEFNDTDYPQNSLLSQFYGSYNEDNFIFGKNYQTLRWLKVSKDLPWTDQVLGNWELGKPIDKEFSSQGDGTVLEMSAYPDQESSGWGFELDHQAIISSPVAIAEIMALLGLEPEPGLEFLANEENFLVFYLKSPAHLEIANLPSNALLGKDDENLKLVIIVNPSLTEDYLVDVVGDNTGYYQLIVGKIEGDESSWQKFDGFTNLGKTDSFQFNVMNFEEAGVNNPLQSIEELFLNLEGDSIDQAMLLKLNYWQELINFDYRQALIYGYRMRNWLSLKAKTSSFDELVFLDSLDWIDSILAHLEKLALAEQVEIKEEEHDGILSFWKEERNSLTPSLASSNSLIKLAAFDFLKSNQYHSFLSEEADYRNLVWAFSGVGLVRNSKVLLYDY